MSLSCPPHQATDQQYTGSMDNEGEVIRWLSDRCVPLVREITFQNGEVTVIRSHIHTITHSQELTEEGLPFLILFYNPDDASSKQVFRSKVEQELLSQKGLFPLTVAQEIASKCMQ